MVLERTVYIKPTDCSRCVRADDPMHAFDPMPTPVFHAFEIQMTPPKRQPRQLRGSGGTVGPRSPRARDPRPCGDRGPIRAMPAPPSVKNPADACTGPRAANCWECNARGDPKAVRKKPVSRGSG